MAYTHKRKQVRLFCIIYYLGLHLIDMNKLCYLDAALNTTYETYCKPVIRRYVYVFFSLVIGGGGQGRERNGGMYPGAQ